MAKSRTSWISFHWLAAAAIASVFLCAGCAEKKDGDAQPDAGADIGCEGEMSCTCSETSECDASLKCLEGVCQPEGCELGLEGCACANGQKCAKDSSGQELVCSEGMCISSRCQSAGETGCPCENGTTCISETDECSATRICFEKDCSPGEKNCECLGNACSEGLFCKDDVICIDNTGFEGGPCLDNGSCYSGYSCDPALKECVACQLGTEGCGCKSNGACDAGLLCQAGVCLGPQEIPPKDPVCYTPCKSDLRGGETGLRTCDQDGLIEGCIHDLVCVEGSCVKQDESPPSCVDDVGCPSFQTCLQGKCYSNCVKSEDCLAGYSCYKKSCRVPCQTASAIPCQEDYQCEAPDGENGYCTPIAPPSEATQELPSGGMDLSKDKIAFSNIKTSGTFSIFPRGDSAQNYTIRKISHTLYDKDGGSTTVNAPVDPVTGEYKECNAAKGECPLFWLSLAYDQAPTQEQELAVEALPNCGEACPVITVTGAGGSPGVKWVGVIEVISKDGSEKITLTYVERPEGQWVGSMYYFGNFSDNGFKSDLDSNYIGWEDRADRSDVSGVDNGLVQNWGAFRKGKLDGWEEFKAVLTSTRTASWNFAEVKKRCEKLNGGDSKAICYPYSNTAGVKTYVFDSDHNFVPSGLNDMPIALNLRLQGNAQGEGAALVGRIESSIAMHYAGMPEVELEFPIDPANDQACNSAISTDCVVYLGDIQSVIHVGGRHLSDNSSDCGKGYEKKKLPWLIPGFSGNTFIESTGPYQYHCVDAELPYDTKIDPDRVASNTSLAWGNPVPNGGPMTRTLRLIDGALINQTELFIMFAESFDSFADSGLEPVSAYGYMILRRQSVDLDPSDKNEDGIIDMFQGAVPPANTEKTVPNDEGLKCDLSFVAEILGDDAPNGAFALSDLDVDSLVERLIVGVDGGTQSPLNSDRESSDVLVNYYCHDTGMFNSGPNDYPGTNGELYACPPGSTVDYFVVTDKAHGQRWLAEQGCQNPNTANIECTNFGCPKCSEVACTVPDDVDDGDLQRYEDYLNTCKKRTGCWETAQEKASCQNTVECRVLESECYATLEAWKSDGTVVEAYEPDWTCSDSNKVYCDEELINAGTDSENIGLESRLDLRKGKKFYAPPPKSIGLLALQSAIDDAFRYKTRFVSRSGSVVGFSPAICIPNSDEIRYCYDPPEIEKAKNRVDCLVEIYTNAALYDKLDEGELPPVAGEMSTKARLDDFLRGNFSEFAIRRDGFERLYSELLIMLGDESFTAAFASRFDLAGANTRSFEGTLFEEDGINLSGVAGAEMFNLYQSVQYYQAALDRLYAAGPNIRTALSRHESTDSSENFISPETVTLYLERLIRASTQRSRAYSQISKSYQNFNRPNLARVVIERAYTAAYLESAVIRDLMNSIAEKSDRAYKPQIRKIIEDAQRRYRMAMLDMRDVYTAITDDVNYFGFAPDYIPFPVVDASKLSNQTASQSPFEVMASIASAKIANAKVKETHALSSNREVNTNSEIFQSELVNVRNNYENQLIELCGTITVTQEIAGEEVERVYPATAKYASLDVNASKYENPCGLMGTGEIHNAKVAYEQTLLRQKQMELKFDRVIQQINAFQESIEALCEMENDKRNYLYEQATDVASRQAGLAFGKVAVEGFNTMVSGDVTTGASVGGLGIIGAAVAANMSWGKIKSMLTKQASYQCQAMDIQGDSTVNDLLLSLRSVDFALLQIARDIQVSVGEITRLINESRRMSDQQEEAEQLLINVEAARSDPNVRLYRNDAIVNADIAFNDALRAVYRATKVFEYYTSQSYARLEQLFLIRMVAAGDYNLENYMLQLTNDYFDFEEEYGLPDVRVALLSLRDDIMDIPTIDKDGKPISRDGRIDMMRKRLARTDMLDSNGYLSIPFSTSLDDLSPLTRNHKTYYIEADVVGSEVGDTIGRLYLRQSGTGVVHNLLGDEFYYVFPEHTAVLDNYFNGNKVFTPELYRNYQHKDRPYVNTAWELIINQTDEEVNKDIDLQSLSDIRLYVYYTDFTSF